MAAITVLLVAAGLVILLELVVPTDPGPIPEAVVAPTPEPAPQDRPSNRVQERLKAIEDQRATAND